MTPHQYIIRCRLRRAMRLLAREELTLADIALEVGLLVPEPPDDAVSKALGTTPGAFRLSAMRWPAAPAADSQRELAQRCLTRGQRRVGSGLASPRRQIPAQ